MKKFTALTLASVMLLALCACGTGGKTDLSAEELRAPLTKDDVITLMVPSSAATPVLDDWKLWEYMEEGSGATLDVISVPGTDMNTKYSLLFAARDELPDVIAFQTVAGAAKYAGEGLVALDDVSNFMPTYNAWLDSLSEEQYAVNVKPRICADGKVYYTPGTGREGKTRMRAWMYREDIFKKHNLKAPETFDELYEVSKKLKELYPDSYPLSTRTIGYVLDIPGSSFDKWWEYDTYYDFDDDEWRWGSMEKETALEVLSFYNKMVKEKLMPADFATLNDTAWTELVITDKAFIIPHLQQKIDYFNSLAQPNNPEFKIQAFVPPVANPEKGAAMIERGDLEMIGFSIPDTGRANGIANAAKFLDWMYTDDAYELLSWGKEGETYEVVDGKKKYICAEGERPDAKYGFTLYGSFTRFDPEAAAAMQSETTLESEAMLREHTLPYYPVTLWLDFNDKEQAVIDTYWAGCKTYTDEMMIKFILGQEPLSGYDAFVENLKDMNVEDVLGAYKSAYDRVK